MSPIIVFAGPSLQPDDRCGERFIWRGPAAAGDMIALLDEKPDAVCLIDGLFDQCAAPWHKEILLLLEAGVRIFGAASMGALRAAELAPFGMRGIGTVFAGYRQGLWHGDDEVALIHAPERLDWAPLSVPMVEVRATLAKAWRSGLLEIECARRIRSAVHDIHYEDRDWATMERRCVGGGLVDAAVFSALSAMHVRLKRADALRCLAAAAGAAGPSPVLEVPRTYFIQQLARQLGMEPGLPTARAPAR